jgi:tetratricopeptide (TPR) repeat protein
VPLTPQPLRIESLNNMPVDSRSFQSNVQLLFEELELATQWERPSILLAICKSRITQGKAEKALEKHVTGLQHGVVRILVDRENADVPRRMLESGRHAASVFFVSNLDQGGGEDGKAAYRSLNMQREFFVDQRVKVVFWLTPGEASALPKHAPDFWAFRHRVIEFAGPRASARKSLPAGALVWRLRAEPSAPASIRESIRAQESLLHGLPAGTEATAQRIELYEILANLHWKLGGAADALDALSRGLAIAGDHSLAHARAWLLNGVAIVSFERADFEKAAEIFTEILETSPEDGFLWMNLAVTLAALGRNREALFRADQALKLSALDSRLWMTAAHIHLVAGKVDEALRLFQKASELEPSAPGGQLGIAASYALMGLAEEAAKELEALKRTQHGASAYVQACSLAIMDDGQRALEVLGSALESEQYSLAELRRDPGLAAALTPAQLSSLGQVPARSSGAAPS